MNRPARILLLAAVMALPLGVQAAEEVKPMGEQTKAWVELQKGGQQASGAPRPMPGEIADNVYQRYADSFKLPIPAEFKRQSTGSSGGSGNGSGQ